MPDPDARTVAVARLAIALSVLERREERLGRAYLAYEPLHVIRRLRLDVEVAQERADAAEARLDALRAGTR